MIIIIIITVAITITFGLSRNGLFYLRILYIKRIFFGLILFWSQQEWNSNSAALFLASLFLTLKKGVSITQFQLSFKS